MPVALLAILESMVLSPTVQSAAWSLIKPHLERGTMPSNAELAKMQVAVNAAHAAAQAPV